MERTHLLFLNDWLIDSDRKPLIIRGARQVGKTWIVRHFAQLAEKKLIELNFEKMPKLAIAFESNDPEQILTELSVNLNTTIDPEQCILFLDEIQGAPELIAKLRWFAEEMPTLPVIAAGSLLEFTLADHSFSMPVGRISYMHLEPLSFMEFLRAHSLDKLIDFLQKYSLSNPMPITIHEQLSKLFREYTLIGGMPAAITKWLDSKSFQEVNKKHNDLLETYKDDFSKYKSRISVEALDEALLSVPKQLATKYVYSKATTSVSQHSIKQALSLLNKSRVSSPVIYSSGNGAPIGAEINRKYFKEIFIDVGLASTCLGLELTQINYVDELSLVNKGGIAEQVAGQLLRTIIPAYKEPKLYYWQRTEKGAEAEIDYLIQHKSQIIPIEVKAGKTGTLKSLHYYMNQKNSNIAVRINSDFPSITDIKVKNHLGKPVEYTLISIPFYLISELHRILDSFQTEQNNF
jgi:predicted AAA+ superfamily ATPase